MASKIKKTKASVLIKNIRAREDMTQKALSELSGISLHRVRCFEWGRHIPSHLEARKLAKVLGCDVMKLLEDHIERS